MHAQSILGKATIYLALPAINASHRLFPLFVMLHSLARESEEEERREYLTDVLIISFLYPRCYLYKYDIL